MRSSFALLVSLFAVVGLHAQEVGTTNWSGYEVATSFTSPQPQAVTMISGAWAIPQLHPTPDNSAVSVWIGIDGDATLSSNMIAQIGTTQKYSPTGGVQTPYAWFQMFPEMMDSQIISTVPVSVGDIMVATVTYLAAEGGLYYFNMEITNLTQNVSSGTFLAYTSTPPDLICAEWIVEAPQFEGVLSSLADFGNLTFTSCTATINGATQAVGGFPNQEFVMVTPQDVLKATPYDLYNSGQNFRVRWESE